MYGNTGPGCAQGSAPAGHLPSSFLISDIGLCRYQIDVCCVRDIVCAVAQLKVGVFAAIHIKNKNKVFSIINLTRGLQVPFKHMVNTQNSIYYGETLDLNILQKQLYPLSVIVTKFKVEQAYEENLILQPVASVLPQSQSSTT